MAWRFKASKYKNAAPKAPKSEGWVRDLNIGSYNSHGNWIKSSAAFIAFYFDVGGTSIGVVPINDSGRKSKLMPTVQAHRDLVTDFDFSPFDDGLLASCGEDSLVKLWRIPENGLQSSVSDPEASLTSAVKRVELVQFHPIADCLLTSAAGNTISLWDVIQQKEMFHETCNQDDIVQSVSWRQDGSMLVSSCKDRNLRVVDPRTKKVSQSTQTGLTGKDSRVVWLGDSTRILSSGFDSSRLRQVQMRDIRNFDQVEKSMAFDSAVGILMPLYDPDTKMLFLAGRADTSIWYLEVCDKDPFLVEGVKFNGEQTKGACLVPKRALNVMEGEVNRMFQLTSSAIVPVSYHVPRKTYRDFHADLFPDTYGHTSTLSPSRWMEGANTPVAKISLDPNQREKKNLTVHRAPLSERVQELRFEDGMNGDSNKGPNPRPEPRPRRRSSTSSENADDNTQNVPVPTPKPRLTNKPTNVLTPRPFVAVRPGGGSVRSVVGITRSLSEESPSGHNLSVAQITVESCNNMNLNGVKNVTNVNEEERNKRNSFTEVTKPDITEDNKKSERPLSTEVMDTIEDDYTFRRTPSIAERRKMYEKRSLSAQEPARSPNIIRRSGAHDNVDVNEDVHNPVPRRTSGSKFSSENADKRKSGGDRLSNPNPPVPSVPKRTTTVFGNVSKYRHLKGTTMHKSTHIENIRNVSNTVPGECDVIYGNKDRVAISMGGPGGKIAVFELSKPGKVPDGVIPALVHGVKIMDFAWNPFDNHCLVAGCDDGKLHVWKIPEGGLTEQTNQSEYTLSGHQEKIYLVKFHPLADGILASASYDLSVRIWDLSTQSQCLLLHGHTDQIFSLSWSPCGQFFSTACKDGRIRVYEPRVSLCANKERKGPAGVRGARVTWALDGQFIIVTGFDKSSERQIMMFRVEDLTTPLHVLGLDVSPTILVPFYDEDSATLFLTGKGDTVVFCYEVAPESPYLCPLSHHRVGGPHQGLAFLPKSVCNIANVEFARALRLTDNSIEPVAFTVPRVKSEFFQDDLFPPTRVTWEPTMTSTQWLNGANNSASRISLKPDNMEALSEATVQLSAPSPVHEKPTLAVAPTPAEAFIIEGRKKQQQQLEKAISNRLEVDMSLEQDHMEGVEDGEWDDN